MALFGPSRVVAQDDAIRLGPQDHLRIRIVEWRDIEGAFGDWSAISGEYIIGAAGTISFPLLGAIQASGLTEVELADAITTALNARVHLTSPPSASVEVLEYRPVYVIGDVVQPGAYPFTPGMTAVQVLALAGGTRVDDLDTLDDASVIRNVGAIEEVEVELTRLLARSDRLEAELAGAESITFDTDVLHPAGTAATDLILAEERQIFNSRREALERERAALADLISLLRSEIATLEVKLVNQTGQIELVRKAVGDMRSLLEQGLARSPTLLNLQSTLINLEAAQLDLESGINRAKQRIAEAERDDLNLLTRRETEGALELQRTRAQIEQLRARRETLALLLTRAGFALDEDEGPDIVFDLNVVRRSDPGTVEFAAGENTPLRPLDVLRVVRRVIERAAPHASADMTSMSTESETDPSAPRPPPPAQTAAPRAAAPRTSGRVAGAGNVTVIDPPVTPSATPEPTQQVAATTGFGAERADPTPARTAAAATASPTAEQPEAAAESAAEVCSRRLNEIVRDDPITFPASKAEPAPASARVLDRLAASLADCGALTIQVAGHTDSSGTGEVNRVISQARAEAVLSALVERGVPAERLRAVGYGEDRPVADNGTRTGRAANRRIEFEVLNP